MAEVLMTVKEAAARLKCSPTHILNLCRKHRWLATNIGTKGRTAWRISEDGIQRLIDGGRKENPKPMRRLNIPEILR